MSMESDYDEGLPHDFYGPECEICGCPADTFCLSCGDYYCYRHDKIHRTEHEAIPVDEP